MSNIMYNVDVEGIKWDGPKKRLPKSISFEISKDELVEIFGEFENTELVDIIDQYAEDKISDETGYCHYGWKQTKIEEKELENDLNF